MSQNFSFTAALREARRRVSVDRFGYEWRIAQRDSWHAAWIPGRCGDWQTIAREASATVAAKALRMMAPSLDAYDADRMIRDAQVDVFPGYAAADLLSVALRNLNP